MRILSIEIIGKTNQVYDLETEAGTFVGGGKENGILLKNTDSCYVNFRDIDRSEYNSELEFMNDQFKRAQECADYCTKQFKPPMSLTFEKYMFPFMLFAKKKYAYLEWNENEKPCKSPGYKGIQVVRRDCCEFVKEELIKVFEIIMNSRSIEEATDQSIKSISDSIYKLLSGDVPMEKLILTKKLKGEYTVSLNKESIVCHWTDPRIKQPHVRLAQKLKKINPTDHPRPPQRVPFVFVESFEPLACDRVSLPKEAKKIDGLYYFEHQFKKPIETLFQFMCPNTDKIFQKFKSLILSKVNKMNKQHNITDFFSRKNLVSQQNYEQSNIIDYSSSESDSEE